MKKKFNLYVISWAILLAIFNVICFVSPAETETMTKFGGAFWSGYIFITLAFIGQLTAAFFAFKSSNQQKFFYKVPLIKISWSGLILTLIFGSICMILPNFPNWAGVILCFVILGFNAISVVKATAAGELVGCVDDKVKVQTFFIKMLTADAESLMARAKDEEAKAQTKKVYEAIRYSDPMSNDALAGVEQQISAKFAELSAAVDEGNSQLIAECAEKVVQLTADRNNKCKVLK